MTDDIQPSGYASSSLWHGSIAIALRLHQGCICCTKLEARALLQLLLNKPLASFYGHNHPGRIFETAIRSFITTSPDGKQMAKYLQVWC